MSSSAVRRWLRRFHPAPHAPTRLVCLPHAGGSASFYFPFSQALSTSAEVLTVQYPGRQERYHEAGLTDLHAMADRIAEALEAETDGRPLALFGHSMGAMLAYEVACRVEDRGGAVEVLFASGRRAPSCPHGLESVHTLTDEGLVAELGAMGGTDTELLTTPGMLRMVLPAIRSDYEAVETYRPRQRPPLRCPVQVLTGDSDPRVDLDQAAAWARHTVGPFDLRVLSGGHFYLTAHQAAVVDLVRQRLAEPTALAAGRLPYSNVG
ncbi:thioesterase II family protein [Kitasatospora sp. NPDC058162]|uniref:thioesterase II family protein n=1 Tax=Kitasatospora sp. NPDC058162 TaxID=3346362 RepID=UPI0036DC2E79